MPKFFLQILLVLTSACLLTAGLVGAAGQSTKEERPNIVYIVSDELGYYELSCMGHPHIKTPNIDRLAAEGTRFTQFLAGSPLCAPTRGVLLTGKHSGHASVRTNGGGTPLRLEEETIASSLKKVGYATGGFGKWGCGGRGSSGVPEKHGFDVFFGYYDQVHAHTYFPPYLIRNSEEVPLKGNAGGESGETYAQYVIMDEAREFIRANHKQPFFCYLPLTPPHGLFNIPDSDSAWGIYKDKPWPEAARRYAAMVTMLDRQVGELRDLLAELGVADNTLIVFTGDNGGQDYFRDKEHPRGFHGPNVNPQTGVEFRGQKGKVYEGGLRIPAIFHMPGRIAAGRVSDHLSYFPDTFPTLAELAGAPTPDDLDGISMLPELFGADVMGREQEQHMYLYWELGGQRAVRLENWKAVRPKKGAAWELYDLSKDVSESNDLAAEESVTMSVMKGFAELASTPAVVGDWGDRTLHEKDRKSKGVKKKAKSAAKKPQLTKPVPPGSGKKRNLLIIHTDEHNFRTLGCYRDTLSKEQALMWGDAVVETPHIDRLAKEGVLCTSYYATSPVCSPSRATLVSGKYPHHTPVVSNNVPLADDIVTFAEVLRRNGWKTGYAGKWHLDGSAKPGWTPQRDFGFSDRRYMFNRGHWKKFEATEAGARIAARNGKGAPSYAVDGADQKSFATDFLTDRTIEFIEANAEQPFCYMLSLPDPHGPDTVRAPYNTMFLEQEYATPRTFDIEAEHAPQWAQPKGRFMGMAQYYGMVKCIDDNVGRIYAALEANGILDSTIVVFTSDHGDLRGEHHRQNKGLPYEGSAKVAFVVRAPELVGTGKLVHEAMATVDFMPTILNMLNVAGPTDMQGRNTASLLGPGKSNEAELSIAYLRQAGKGDKGWLAAVTDRYKLVVSASDQPYLFDLELDPDELINYYSSAEHQPIRDLLTQRLKVYADEFQDPYNAGLRWAGMGSPKAAK